MQSATIFKITGVIEEELLDLMTVICSGLDKLFLKGH